jgi:hypothetical protein
MGAYGSFAGYSAVASSSANNPQALSSSDYLIPPAQLTPGEFNTIYNFVEPALPSPDPSTPGNSMPADFSGADAAFMQQSAAGGAAMLNPTPMADQYLPLSGATTTLFGNPVTNMLIGESIANVPYLW